LAKVDNASPKMEKRLKLMFYCHKTISNDFGVNIGLFGTCKNRTGHNILKCDVCNNIKWI